MFVSKTRIIQAAKAYTSRIGYTCLGSWENEGAYGIVAKNDEALAFIQLMHDEAAAGFPEIDQIDRTSLEAVAIQWLKDNRDSALLDVAVRFDAMHFVVIAEDKAFMRHHINALGTD